MDWAERDLGCHHGGRSLRNFCRWLQDQTGHILISIWSSIIGVFCILPDVGNDEIDQDLH